MPHPDADRWNARYSRESDLWLSKPPRQLLLDYAHLLPTHGLALDAAAGVGTSGLFLAQRGLRVIAVDVSETALRLAVQRARARSLPLAAAVCDLAQPWLPADHFAVIVNFHFLERATFSAYRQALQPGGLLFFEAFVRTGRDLPSPHYYLEPGELRQAFQGFEILHEGGRGWSDCGKVTEQLVARKPRP